MRFRVKSRSQPGHRMVDLIANECSCPDWTTRHKKYEARTGKLMECDHIKEAWESVKAGIRQHYKTK